MRFNTKRHGAGTLLQYTAETDNIQGVVKDSFLLVLDCPDREGRHNRQVFNLKQKSTSGWHPFNLKTFCKVMVASPE